MADLQTGDHSPEPDEAATVDSVVSTADVINAQEAGELVTFIFGRRSDDDTSLIEALVELHNDGRISITELTQDKAFDELSPSDYFFGQEVVCRVIPRVAAPIEAMMRFVKSLVTKAGHDLMAGQPNIAFGEWCRAKIERTDQIVKLAESGDSLAIEFLSIGLSSGHHFAKAIEIARTYPDQRQISAIAGLGRMDGLTPTEAQAALDAISAAVASRNDDLLRANALGAALDIAEKGGINDGKILHILEVVCLEPGPQTQYLCARSVMFQAATLDARLLEQLLAALREVDPQSKGTLRELDAGLSALLKTTNGGIATDFVAGFLQDNPSISFADLPSFEHQLVNGNSARLARVLISWLLSGRRPLCEALTHAFRRGRPNLSVLDGLSIEEFALSSEQMLFLCRKAIGYFFLEPLVATRVLLATMHAADLPTRAAVSELLADPLLLNYGGEPREYLQRIEEEDVAYPHVQASLDATREYLAALDSVGSVKELAPSEHQRQIERQRLHEQSRRIRKGAEEHSVFMSLVHRSTLLHGRRSITYVGQPGEERRPMKMDLKTHSVSFELPRMEVIDPFGLDYMLRAFRAEGGAL